MPTTRVSKQPAFILHRRPYRESSALVDLFTRDHGRICGVMRGARGSRRSAHVQPLQPLLVDWSGRHELKTLGNMERVATNPPCVGDRLYSALYINELLQRLLPAQDPHPDLFDRYTRVLPAVALTDDLEGLLRGFELALLDALGYGAELSSVAGTGGTPEPDALYVYIPGQGLHPALGNQTNAVPGRVFSDIAAARFDQSDTRRIAKQLLRASLSVLLGERPLSSRELFLSRRRDTASPSDTDQP